MPDDILIKYPRKDVSFSEYSDSVNYKKLALKTWYKYNQFELWREQKKCARLFKYKDCTCFTYPDLEIMDIEGKPIEITETNEDEFDSRSSYESSEVSDGEESLEKSSLVLEERFDLFLE